MYTAKREGHEGHVYGSSWHSWLKAQLAIEIINDTVDTIPTVLDQESWGTVAKSDLPDILVAHMM